MGTTMAAVVITFWRGVCLMVAAQQEKPSLFFILEQTTPRDGDDGDVYDALIPSSATVQRVV